MSNKRRTLSTLTALVVGCALSWMPSADAKAPKPQVTMAQARAIALAAVPGKILEEDLEREHGHQIYSFEIVPTNAPKGTVKEVHVDAKRGTVVAIEDEAAQDEDHDDDDNDDD